eukprot:CAMPEP_0175305706 /NCGR_PEP_ID=MMETSP0093-20121207/63881_1 /TAXON_ID=311494 /ORGANISM="Alexandrium monilatum, Strain CCMP3105" /LENGTH=53 /DNA_ID=CAMNT_0016602139 /DNA_START=138 /DNA_END=296 /DNA_ORIENTATION=+
MPHFTWSSPQPTQRMACVENHQRCMSGFLEYCSLTAFPLFATVITSVCSGKLL